MKHLVSSIFKLIRYITCFLSMVNESRCVIRKKEAAAQKQNFRTAAFLQFEIKIECRTARIIRQKTENMPWAPSSAAAAGKTKWVYYNTQNEEKL